MSHGRMSIGLHFHPVGTHPASWLCSDAPAGAEVSIDYYAEVARIAESGALDFMFFADVPAMRDGNMAASRRWPLYAAQFEPVTLLGALAASTRRLGLAATVSTSFYEPYNLARQFASLDHLSKGRVAWNVVTTSSGAAAFNFGRNPRQEHAQRYERAREFLAIVKGLWDSWDDDAFPRDKASGVFFDPGKLHRLDFNGKHFAVRGPLNVPRSPQGHPVIIQAGGSETGKAFAAETAEVAFTTESSLAGAQKFYADLKGRLPGFMRTEDQLKILSGLKPILGMTKTEAEDKFDRLQRHIHPDVGREILSIDLDGVDLSDVPLDSPIPDDKIPKDVEGGKSYFGYLRKLMDNGPITVRQLYEIYAPARGGNFIVGTPKDIADMMEEWFVGKAADGFMIGLAYVPCDARLFVEHVVPALRRRGLFRLAYEGATLRDHLGLARPVSRYASR
ncbi:MAG TPA: LLM class flavin-dependent oxidoreductase [Bordetella sp.]